MVLWLSFAVFAATVIVVVVVVVVVVSILFSCDLVDGVDVFSTRPEGTKIKM